MPYARQGVAVAVWLQEVGLMLMHRSPLWRIYYHLEQLLPSPILPRRLDCTVLTWTTRDLISLLLDNLWLNSPSQLI